MNGAESEAIALAGGVLFAVHPITTFAVVPLTELSIVLATLFSLLSLVLYVKASSEDNINPVGYMLSILAFGLAWSCGMWTWVLPVFIVLLTVVLSGWGACKQRALYIFGYVVVAGMLIAQRYVLADVPSLAVDMDGFRNEAQNLLLVIKGWLIPGSAPRAFPEYYTEAVGTSIPLIALLVLGIALSTRWVSIGLCIVWPALIVLGFGLAISSDAFDIAHAYPAGVGLACLFSVVIHRAPQGKVRTGVGIVVAGLIAMCMIMTHLRTSEWKDEEFYWNLAKADCATCFEPNYNLATFYKQQGDDVIAALEGVSPTETQMETARRSWSQAESLYIQAQRADPLAQHVDSPLARVQAGLAKFDEAIASMKRALAVAPDDTQSIRYLAQWYGQQAVASSEVAGFHTASELYARLETLGALTERDHLQWGVLLYQLGAYVDAARHLQSVKDPKLRQQVAALIQTLNPRITQLNVLQEQLKQAQASNASPLEILRIRAQQLTAQGDRQSALYHAEEVVRTSGLAVQPEDWYLLGYLYGQQGSWETFVATWAVPEGFTAPWQGLSQYCASKGDWNTALVAMMRRPVFPGGDARAEALVSVSQMAIQAKDYTQANQILQAMIQQYPRRFEPWLILGEVGHLTKNTEMVRSCLREAKARGASEAALKALRDRAGIEEGVADSLAPTLIK